MASVEQLKMTHSIDDRVRGVEGQVQDVRGDMQDVCGDVRDVGSKVQHVEDRVQGVGEDISSRVQGVDDKLDQADRSLSCSTLIIIPRAETDSQGISSETNFFDGSRPQIHPPIITSHAKLITTVPLSGFFKEVYSINGSPLAPSCGCMENVCYS
jgi:hypothetical protein